MDIPTLLQLITDGVNNISEIGDDIHSYLLREHDGEIVLIDMDGIEFRIKITKYPNKEI